MGYSPSMSASRAMTLATERGLHAYDGYTLELARNRSLPLLTLDAKRQGRRAARRHRPGGGVSENVHVL